MACRPLPGVTVWLVLVCIGSLIDPGSGRAQGTDESAVAPPSARPGTSMPVARTLRYRMAGKIRPLLFWIGRDEVGAGEIVWRRGPDGAVAYELLIGSDPALAPKRLNRWGYLAEETRGAHAEVFGIISASDEESLGDVRAELDAAQRGGAFRTIRASVTAAASTAAISLVHTEPDLTFHDLGTVLALTDRQLATVPRLVTPRPEGARPGFLTAMSELIRDSVAALAGGGVHPVGEPRAYIYGDGLHDLTLRSHRFHLTRRIDDVLHRRVIHGKFRTRSRASGEAAAFEVIYGTEPPLVEAPVWIRYQPRWWLRVELVLDRSAKP